MPHTFPVGDVLHLLGAGNLARSRLSGGFFGT
jgi:hypothetical protein